MRRSDSRRAGARRSWWARSKARARTTPAVAIVSSERCAAAQQRPKVRSCCRPAPSRSSDFGDPADRRNNAEDRAVRSRPPSPVRLRRVPRKSQRSTSSRGRQTAEESPAPGARTDGRGEEEARALLEVPDASRSPQSCTSTGRRASARPRCWGRARFVTISVVGGGRSQGDSSVRVPRLRTSRSCRSTIVAVTDRLPDRHPEQLPACARRYAAHPRCSEAIYGQGVPAGNHSPRLNAAAGRTAPT